MIRRLVMTVLALLAFNVSAAEYEHCNSLLEHGITNVTRYMSADHSVAYKWHSNCGQNFDNASDSSVRKASISIFGYGGAGSDTNSAHTRTRLKQWCDNNSEFAASRHDMFEEARVVSDSALNAWNQCQSIAQKGIKVTPIIQGEYDEFVSITIDSDSDGTHLFYGVEESGYACVVYGADRTELESNRINKGAGEYIVMATERQTINNANIHISCKRNLPKISEENGVGKLLYDEGYISVMTSGPALPLATPKVVESYYVTPPKSVLAFNAKACPSGWEEYKPAYGRFIRGIDKSDRKVDPDGLREPGSTQDEDVIKHAHSYQDIYWSEAWGSVGGGLYGNKGDQDRDNKGYEMSRMTSGVGGAETRPDNVALLYCVKL